MLASRTTTEPETSRRGRNRDREQIHEPWTKECEIAENLANRIELSWSAATVALDIVFAKTGHFLAHGREVRVPGFGTFRVTHRQARHRRNPQTG